MNLHLLLLAAAATTASVTASEIPPPAYQLAVHGTGVPTEVLYALARTESGTKLHGKVVPWPWTLNVASTPYRFPTRSAACAALLQAIREVGHKRVDAGLGQLNIGWQRERFSQPCDALDPYFNLKVTASILAEQRAESSNWIEAAGRYHRPAGGIPARRYEQSFTLHLEAVTGAERTGDSR